MASPSKLFPRDPSDPFQQQASSTDNSDLSSWTNDIAVKAVPKWHLLTAKEETEKNQVISKLEAKIANIKSRSDRYYTQQKTYHNVSSAYLESDDESFSEVQSEHEQGNQATEEEEEGLPLLWKTKAGPLDKKAEHQYTKQSFCCCC